MDRAFGCDGVYRMLESLRPGIVSVFVSPHGPPLDSILDQAVKYFRSFGTFVLIDRPVESKSNGTKVLLLHGFFSSEESTLEALNSSHRILGLEVASTARCQEIWKSWAPASRNIARSTPDPSLPHLRWEHSETLLHGGLVELLRAIWQSRRLHDASWCKKEQKSRNSRKLQLL